MKLLAIDPGPTQSAWVGFEDGRPCRFGIEPNAKVLDLMRDLSMWGVSGEPASLAIESVASYGMAVGADVFETCVWSGRFIQGWLDAGWLPWRDEDSVLRVYRKDVKLWLCGSARAKDANVRQALIDRYGGKERAISKKANPGPLYGVTSHVWSALAVAVTAADTMAGERVAA